MRMSWNEGIILSMQDYRNKKYRRVGGGGRTQHSIQAYMNESEYPRPQIVIRQLPPPALVHDGTLVRDAAEHVHGRGDQRDDAEDAGRAEGLLGFADAAAGGDGAGFEEVGAFVGAGA